MRAGLKTVSNNLLGGLRFSKLNPLYKEVNFVSSDQCTLCIVKAHLLLSRGTQISENSTA